MEEQVLKEKGLNGSRNLGYQDSQEKESFNEEMEQFLTFLVSDELFAINILQIKELIEYSSVTHIPMMSNCIHGVINLRGNVIPVVDLSRRIERQISKITKRSSIIFVEVEYEDAKVTVGILVDAVAEVVDVPLSKIEKAPDFGAKIRSEYISQIAKINDRFVIILDTSNALKIEELSKLEDSLENVLGFEGEENIKEKVIEKENAKEKENIENDN